jgi:hypothetical protein
MDIFLTLFAEGKARNMPPARVPPNSLDAEGDESFNKR